MNDPPNPESEIALDDFLDGKKYINSLDREEIEFIYYLLSGYSVVELSKYYNSSPESIQFKIDSLVFKIRCYLLGAILA